MCGEGQGIIIITKKYSRFLIKSLPGWWRNLPTIEMGMQIFNLARTLGFTNHILTKGPRHHANAWQEKVEWCRRYLGDVQVHITSNKGLVYGKFLYDDFPEYCELWLAHRPRGLVIMPDTEYNQNFHHPQVLRWTGKNLDEVLHALKVCLRRKDKEPLMLRRRDQ